MKVRIICLCALCAFLLASCNVTQKEYENGMDAVLQREMDEIRETENEPVYVSVLATEDFLEPLEDYSWEREYHAEYVMLHFTSNVVNNREEPYVMEDIRNIFISGGVSINYIIDRDGGIHCYIPENRAAWHAGKGTFANDEKYTNAMNKYSVGIEIVAVGSQNDMEQYLTAEEYASLDENLIGFTEAQYESVSSLVKDICERNGIPLDRAHVLGHDEYNPEKSDPGELFDWEKVFEQ